MTSDESRSAILGIGSARVSTVARPPKPWTGSAMAILPMPVLRGEGSKAEWKYPGQVGLLRGVEGTGHMFRREVIERVEPMPVPDITGCFRFGLSPGEATGEIKSLGHAQEQPLPPAWRKAVPSATTGK